LQTNATLITEDWCDFFSRHTLRVGVSLDGPKEIHDKYRRDRRGRGTFEKTLRGIQMLQKNGIPIYVIAVLHKESLQSPDQLFHFFEELRVSEVCFNIEEIESA